MAPVDSRSAPHDDLSESEDLANHALSNPKGPPGTLALAQAVLALTDEVRELREQAGLSGWRRDPDGGYVRTDGA